MSDLHDIIIFRDSGLDWDSAQQYLSKGDSRFRMNIVNSEKGIKGILSNVDGNKERNLIVLPTGNNTVIGFCEDIENSAGIIFLYNDQNNHCILRYSPINDSVDPLIWGDSILNFNINYSVTGHIIGGLLYFNDGLNPQRKLNMMKAFNYTNKLYNGGIGVWRIAVSPEFYVS